MEGEDDRRERERMKLTGRERGSRDREREGKRVDRKRKKKISPGGGRGDWHSRLVKLRWPRMENEVFGRGEREHLSGTVGQFKRKIQKVN